VAAFELLVGIHYLYYRFCGNMLMALVWCFPWHGEGLGVRRLASALLGSLFFLGSRDSLSKYYVRAGQLLGVSGQTESSPERASALRIRNEPGHGKAEGTG
jgi:hypothetical protein